MKAKQERNVHSALLTFAAVLAVAAALSTGACRTSPFGMVKLASLSVAPANPVMAGGTTMQLSVTGNYTDGSTRDMTAAVTWVASDPTVTISASGLASAARVDATDSCTVTAVEPGGVSGSVSLTVRNAQLTAINVSPGSAALDGGTTVRLTAAGTFAAGGDTFLQDITSLAAWNSSDDGCAAADAGTVTGVSGGTASVTASWEGVTSNSVAITVSGKVLVSLDIEPQNDIIRKMGSDFFTVAGTFDDGTAADLTQSATWSVSDNTIAIIGPYNAIVPGIKVTALMKPGTVTITAQLGSKTANTNLTVSATAGPY